MQLNDNQKKAVEHSGTPLLIIAGAGTGKTTVITERVIFLMEQQQVAAESILALTFTEKAATEMLERIDIRLPLGHSEPTVKTFHAFCDQILRRYGLEIGINTGFKIMTEVESWIFFKEHLFDFSFDYYRPFGNPTKFIGALVSYFGKLQDENVLPLEYLEFAKKHPASTDEEKQEKKRHVELAKAYGQYLDMKLSKDVFEFSDLHFYVLKLFRERPNVLKKIQEQYTHILVDEFQDTNLIQFQLIQLIAGTGSDLTVVADDDQSIYAFRGSNISNILNFSRIYKNAEKISLVQNYRSPQSLLDSAYELIQFNNPNRLEVKEQVSKKLVSTAVRHDKEAVFFHSFTHSEEENAFIVDTIENCIKTGRSLSDIAILVRANSYADPISEELHFRGIPYQFLGLKGLYDCEEIKDLLSLLRFLRNQRDSVSLFRLIRISFFGFEMEEILLLLNEARSRKVALWDLLKKIEKDKAKKFVEIISGYIEKSRDYKGGSVLHQFLMEYYYPKLLNEVTLENERKILNIHEFFNRIKQFESRSAEQSIVELIDFLDLVIEAGENPATAESDMDIEAIKIMTVHASKGLEFPIVFVPALVSQRFPGTNRSETVPFPDGLKKDLLPSEKTNIAEERRLFYVACTRVREQLFLTASKYYGDAKRPKKVSQFISELKLTEFNIEDSRLKIQDSKSKIPDLKEAKEMTQQIRREVPRRFSYSQISMFEKCPRQYEYAYIYKIQGESTPALSFGNSMHTTLKRFYDYLAEISKPTLFGEQKDVEKVLLDIYDQSFVYSDYLSKKHQKQAYDAGKKMLKAYYGVNGPEFTLPYLTEKSFVLPIGDFIFSGRLDRIDKLDTGSCEVIDYKTGKKKTQKEVDKDKQLSLYALACRDVLRLQPKKLSLYFLDDQEKIETVRTDEQMDDAKEAFQKIAEAICASDYSPTPSQQTCKYCPYRNICDKAIM